MVPAHFLSLQNGDVVGCFFFFNKKILIEFYNTQYLFIPKYKIMPARKDLTSTIGVVKNNFTEVFILRKIITDSKYNEKRN